MKVVLLGRQLIQVSREDHVKPAKGDVVDVPCQAQVRVHAVQHEGGDEADLVHYEHRHVRPELLQHREVRATRQGGVAGFAVASVHHWQEQTLVKGDPVDVAGCHSCGCGNDDSVAALTQHVGCCANHHGLPAASGPVQKHAQTLCAVAILGVRAVHDFAKDVLHGLPLARCCRSWLLGGQKVEGFFSALNWREGAASCVSGARKSMLAPCLSFSASMISRAS